MDKQQKFYSALRDLFIGGKVEGKSGYVNLMDIKSKYFNKIEKLIREKVANELEEEKRDELYDKLYTFFDSYFSNGGAIFFSSTPIYKNIYARVYSDREDVSLFWKTKDLYYVKTEVNYQSINLTLNKFHNFSFYFDASELEHKKNNEKKELNFYFVGVEKKDDKSILKFKVRYKENVKYDKLKEYLNVKDTDKLKEYLFKNLNNINHPNIETIKNSINLSLINFKNKTKPKVKGELLISKKDDVLEIITIEPVITDIQEIIKYLNKEMIDVLEDDILRAFKIYKKQNEVDYFIHKDATKFLKEQFDLYIYQYLANDIDTIFDKERLDTIRKIKEIAYYTIELIGKFENELKKMWLKPKFVRKSNYVITIDKILSKDGGLEVINKILEHKGINKQIKEWKELSFIEEDFKKDDVYDKRYQYLSIDTKHFDEEIKYDILSLFDDLDNELDGYLIKSDNFQALNTILPKFKEKIQTIYIDPPYNTGSDDFLYKDSYKHSSWLTMMENRLSLARDLLKEEGVIFSSIGDTIRKNIRVTSLSYLQQLFNLIFSEENFIATLIRKSGIAPRQDVKYIANSQDYILFYAKNFDKAKINKKFADILRLKYKDEYFKERGYFDLNQLDRGSVKYSKTLDYPIIIEKGEIIEIFDGKSFKKELAPEKIEIWPGGDSQDKRWIFRWSKEKVKWGIENGFIVFKKNKKWKVYYKEYELVDNNLNIRKRVNPYDTLILEYPNELGSKEIENLFNNRLFEYPKPSNLIEHILKIGSDKNSFVLDFFAGSGTTAHAVMKLNKEDGGKRRFILVEMGEYFDTVIIPRIKKIAYSFNWKKGKPQDVDGIGGFFKYYELEQFEDVLKKAVYKPKDNKIENIEFSLDVKLAKDGLEIDIKKEVARYRFDRLYFDVDTIETISNLVGKKIKKITKEKVIFEDNFEVDLNNLTFEKYPFLKPLIWWE